MSSPARKKLYRKIKAVIASGGAATGLIFVGSLTGVHITQGVAAGIVALVASFFGYQTPENDS